VGGADPEVVGGVEADELAEDGPGEGEGPVGWAGEGQDPELAERDGDRGVGEPGGPADQLLRRLQEPGVVLDEGVVAGVEAGRGGERDRATADPDGEEVGVGGAALPEAVGFGDRSPESRWSGMEVLGDGELGCGQVVGLSCGPGEVGEVAAPCPAGGPAFDQAEGQAGDHRGGGGADDERDQPGGAGTGDGEQERQRPPTADQRHEVLEPAGQG
jgi:hypothetical protein